MRSEDLKNLNEEYYRFVRADAEINLTGVIPIGPAFLYYKLGFAPSIVAMAAICGMISMTVTWFARGRDPSFLWGDLIYDENFSSSKNLQKFSDEYQELTRIRKSRRYIVRNTVAAALLFPFSVWVIQFL